MKTLEELKVVRDSMKGEVALRTHGNASSKYERHVLVCGGTGCTSSGSPKIIAELEKEFAEKGLTDKVQIVKTGCFGLCERGPIMAATLLRNSSMRKQLQATRSSHLTIHHSTKSSTV